MSKIMFKLQFLVSKIKMLLDKIKRHFKCFYLAKISSLLSSFYVSDVGIGIHLL